MWLGSRREYPPPYQHQNIAIHGLESPRGHEEWQRRSFSKRSVRRHSERRDRDAQPVTDRGSALPSPSLSSTSMAGIEQEWCKIRQAQEQVRKDRQTLERDKAAHEAKVRYELEQLGRDIEDERRRLRQRGNGGGGGYYGFLPHSPQSEEAIVDEEEEEVYHHSWFVEYGYPSHDGYWGMNGGPDAPAYEDEEDVNDERSFTGWESDDEPEDFVQSAYRSYFQSPPRYNCGDFDESPETWADESPSYRERPRYSDQKREDIKKAYNAYTEKWKTISATASSVPYPTTNLTSALLLDTPEINTDAPLSEDQTIELNTTLFYLLAFDLQPNMILNSAGTPKIEIEEQAELEKVKALQRQMKIERIRWHPDSLVKRRVDGMVEEVESKGVYRAVDELLEECKGRLDGA